MLDLLRKKFINKIKYSRSSPDPDFLGVTMISHENYFQFLPISRHLWTTQENHNRSIRSRRISCNWRKKFRLSQKEIFLEPIQKSPCIVNYLWAGVSNYICSIILVITKRPTFLDCVNSNIYSCILSLLKLHKKFWFMN